MMSRAGHGEFPPKDVIPDTVNGFRYVRDLYDKSNDTSGAPGSAACCSHAVSALAMLCWHAHLV